MVQMTGIAEMENAAETVLKTKGFENAVVSITDGMVDVVLGRTSITDAERAQIEDVVKRKTDIGVENMTISLMNEADPSLDTSAGISESQTESVSEDVESKDGNGGSSATEATNPSAEVTETSAEENG